MAISVGCLVLFDDLVLLVKPSQFTGGAAGWKEATSGTTRSVKAAPQSRGVCDVVAPVSRKCLLPAVGDDSPFLCQSPSASVIWDHHKSNILNASFYPEQHASNIKFVEWIADLFQYYSPTQLRLSVSNAANPIQTTRLLEILSRRYDALRTTTRRTNSSELPEPLRILVTGGSVTQGVNCDDNPVGVGKSSTCAWSYRLEYMFNHAFFEGQPVVQITNIGMGGASAQVAATNMEYRLLPDPRALPHVVIYSHSANDSREPSVEEFARTELQRYVQAAYSLRPCDDVLPVIVLAEDLYSIESPSNHNKMGGYSVARTWSNQLHNLATWYGLMYVNYPNAVRHQLVPNVQNETFVRHFLGGPLTLHHGTGFHIGMAWALLFNFLTAFTDACNEQQQQQQQQQSRFPTEGKDEGDLVQTDDSTRTTSFNASSSRSPLSHPLQQVHSPSVKHIGKYVSDGLFQNMAQEWLENEATSRQTCMELEKAGDKNEVVCTYAWMAMRTTQIVYPKDVDAILRDVLVGNQGWKAMGYPIRQPRTGWYAQQANATFSLEIHPTLSTKYLTIMSMQSYGPNFVGTKLEVAIQVVNSASTGGGSNKNKNETSSPPTTTTSQATYEIDPYHETRTSIHVPHKLELPGGGATEGDTVRVHARLTSGSYFKIQGLAFCRS